MTNLYNKHLTKSVEQFSEGLYMRLTIKHFPSLYTKTISEEIISDMKFHIGKTIDVDCQFRIGIKKKMNGQVDMMELFIEFLNEESKVNKVFVNGLAEAQKINGQKITYNSFERVYFDDTEDNKVKVWGPLDNPQMQRKHGFIINENFIWNFKIEVYKLLPNNTSLQDPELSFLDKNISQDFAQILQYGHNSDVELCILGENGVESQIKAHKIILCARSPVFHAMLKDEAKTKESQTGKIIIKDFSEQTIRLMLQFIYTGAIDGEWRNYAAELIRAADMYSIQSFSQFIEDNLILACKPENAIGLLKIAKLCNLSTETVQQILAFVRDNLENSLDYI